MEIWKDILGYENEYEISSYGRVRAKYREFIGKDGKLKKYHPRYLKLDSSIVKKGYARVTLSKDYKIERFQVHRLVAEHFIPNPENKPFVNHIDNNGLNNHVTNLEWCTQSENMMHAQKQGRLFNAQSKGGTIGGNTMRTKSLVKANTLIGTRKFDWVVRGISNSRKGNKLALDLECLRCNQIYSRTMEYFNNSIGQCCINCKSR